MGAALVVILGGLKLAAPLVVPLMLAAGVATGALPVADWLRARGVPDGLAVGLTIILALGALALFGYLVVSASEDLATDWPYYQADLATLQQRAAGVLHGFGLAKLGARVEGFDAGQESQQALLGAIHDLPGFASAFGVVVLVVVFVLFEATSLRRRVAAAYPHADTHRAQRTVRQIQRYLFIKTATSAVTGLLVGLWTWGWDVPHADLWGLLAFVLNFVPVIGSIVAAIPAVVVALATVGPLPTLAVAGGYLFVNVAIGNFVEPVWMGRSAGLSPLVVLLSMIVWGWVLGPVGALLSVPLTMVVKIALLQSRDLHPVAVMMSADGQVRASDPGAQREVPTLVPGADGARERVSPTPVSTPSLHLPDL